MFEVLEHMQGRIRILRARIQRELDAGNTERAAYYAGRVMDLVQLYPGAR